MLFLSSVPAVSFFYSSSAMTNFSYFTYIIEDILCYYTKTWQLVGTLYIKIYWYIFEWIPFFTYE